MFIVLKLFLSMRQAEAFNTYDFILLVNEIAILKRIILN